MTEEQIHKKACTFFEGIKKVGDVFMLLPEQSAARLGQAVAEVDRLMQEVGVTYQCPKCGHRSKR